MEIKWKTNKTRINRKSELSGPSGLQREGLAAAKKVALLFFRFRLFTRLLSSLLFIKADPSGKPRILGENIKSASETYG